MKIVYTTNIELNQNGVYPEPSRRMQDPTNTQSYNRYSYVINNPLKYTDPSGEIWGLLISTAFTYLQGVNANGGNWNPTKWDPNNGAFVGVGVTTNGNPNGTNAYHLGTGIGSIQTNTVLNGDYTSSIPGINWSAVDAGRFPQSNSSILQSMGIPEPNLNINLDQFEFCSDCANPSSVGENIGGLIYAGPDNPVTLGGDFSYQPIPENKADYPAIGHDRRYDNLKVTGASGLFTDTRAIGADWRFVTEEFIIFSNPHNSIIDRGSAFFLGSGLAGASLPKTLYTISKRDNFYNYIKNWYRYSNRGVNNNPSP